MSILYENIISLCQSKGIKGGKMCTDIGISKGLLTDLKMGRRTGVSAVTAQKIASYFDVSVGYLLGNEEIKEDPTAQGGEAVKNPSDELELTEGEIAWIKIMRRFPPEQKAVLIEKLLSELDKNP